MENSGHSWRGVWLWAVFLGVPTVVVAAGGYSYFRFETDRIRQERYQDLAAIGELKAGEIQHWRTERLNDVARFAKAPFFRRALTEWLQDRNNTVLKDKLQHRLVIDRETKGYTNVLLLDPDGRVLLTAKPEPDPLGPAGKQAYEEALARRSAALSDLYRSPQGIVQLDAMAPVMDEDEQDRKSVV